LFLVVFLAPQEQAKSVDFADKETMDLQFKAGTGRCPEQLAQLQEICCMYFCPTFSTLRSTPVL
jgi:hypothetical protein